MQRVISLSIIPALALILAGCSDSNPYPRAEFPSAPGFYVQSYKDGLNTVVELASVDAGGKVTSIRSSTWHARPSENKILNETAVFPECGVALTFRPGPEGKLMTSELVTSHSAKRSCPLGPLPAVWSIVPSGER